jgi:hypothetical protein
MSVECLNDRDIEAGWPGERWTYPDNQPITSYKGRAHETPIWLITILY